MGATPTDPVRTELSSPPSQPPSQPPVKLPAGGAEGELFNRMNTGGVGNGPTAPATFGKMLAEDLVEIGKRKAQRMVRRGYEAGEDYLDESKRYIKHNPWQCVGAALGVGLVLGFVGGFLSRRH